MLKSPERRFMRLVYPLALAQLILWGSIYSSFTLFIAPMQREFGWSMTQISAAFSLGLLVSGVMAIPVGCWIDRRGGFWPLVGGSSLAAFCFVIWAASDHYVTFLLAWFGSGIAMAAVLTQPAYAVIVQNLEGESRRGILISTIFSGFSATLFIPLTSFLIGDWGWRSTLLCLAGLNLLCAGLHTAVVPRTVPVLSAAAPPANSSALPPLPFRVARSLPFWGIVVAFALNAAVTAALAVLLVPLLQERGYGLTVAVAAVALIGPAQIASRLLLALAGFRGMSAYGIGLIALALKLFAMIALLFCNYLATTAWMVYPFSIINGLSGGAVLIVLAIITTELFGTQDYAVIQGSIQTAITLARAVAPIGAASLLHGQHGSDRLVWVFIGLVLAALFSLAVAGLPWRIRPTRSSRLH